MKSDNRKTIQIALFQPELFKTDFDNRLGWQLYDGYLFNSNSLSSQASV